MWYNVEGMLPYRRNKNILNSLLECITPTITHMCMYVYHTWIYVCKCGLCLAYIYIFMCIDSQDLKFQLGMHFSRGLLFLCKFK